MDSHRLDYEEGCRRERKKGHKSGKRKRKKTNIKRTA
jgi:hypothetical protein